MTSKKFLFTSESVTEGHPDKVCDQISDAILDEFLTKDPSSRVAAETTATTGMVLVCGEITSNCYVDIPQIVRNTIKSIGYEGSSGGGFDANTCAVLTSIDEQSCDIAGGVNKAYETRSENADTSVSETENIGAGDQGIMFGYACNETPELMPLPISLAHKLSYRLAQVRKEGKLTYLRPDGKSQVTVEYVDGKPSRIDTILLSTQHSAEIDGISDNSKVQEIINQDLRKYVIDYVFETEMIKPDSETKILINPSGRFVVGGPQGDTGLTGRKIIVDTYGGYSRHGGGAFSGKDPTKVDRSAAYAARYVAKNIVAAGLADKCEIELAYAIGVAEPISVFVDTFGTGKISDDEISDIVKSNFELSPMAIIIQFDLRNLPAKNGGKFYQKLASYGHMGRTDISVPWEATDKAELLKKNISSIKRLIFNKTQNFISNSWSRFTKFFSYWKRKFLSLIVKEKKEKNECEVVSQNNFISNSFDAPRKHIIKNELILSFFNNNKEHKNEYFFSKENNFNEEISLLNKNENIENIVHKIININQVKKNYYSPEFVNFICLNIICNPNSEFLLFYRNGIKIKLHLISSYNLLYFLSSIK